MGNLPVRASHESISFAAGLPLPYRKFVEQLVYLSSHLIIQKSNEVIFLGKILYKSFKIKYYILLSSKIVPDLLALCSF